MYVSFRAYDVQFETVWGWENFLEKSLNNQKSSEYVELPRCFLHLEFSTFTIAEARFMLVFYFSENFSKKNTAN
jgi:hypothetical protein